MEEVQAGRNVKYLEAGVTSYNIDVNDDFIFVNTSLGPVTIYLPYIKGSGLDYLPKNFYISDYSGLANVNPITILAARDQLNSGAAVAIASAYGSAECTIINPNEWFVLTDGSSGSLTGANNALEVNTGIIQWGGFLVKDTTVSGNNLYGVTFTALTSFYTPMGATTNNTFMYQIPTLWSAGWYDVLSGQTTGFSANGTKAAMNVSNGEPLSSIELYPVAITVTNNGTNNNMVITDQLNSKGLVYLTDYSSNFTPESLISKRYAAATYAPIFSGTLNYIPKFTPSGSAIGNSQLFDNGVSVGLGTATPSASSLFDITSTTKGFLAPRMTTTQRDAISSPATGLFIYNTSSSFFNYWDGATWIQVDTSTGGDVSGSGTTNKIPLWTDGPNSVLGDSYISQSTTSILFTPVLATSGAITNFNFTNPANTNQTLSTEIPSYKYNGGSRQWATGTIATQRENYQTTTTYTAVGATTITNAYGMYVEAPTASTNITITNNYSAGFSGNIYVSGVTSLFGPAAVTGQRAVRISQGTGYVDIGNASDGTANGFISFNQTTNTKDNSALYGTSALTVLNSNTNVLVKISDLTAINIATTSMSFTIPFGGGVGTDYTFNAKLKTGLTLGTNTSNFKITGASSTWATGALATQYFNYLSANTVAFAATSTATDVFNLYVDANTAGTNATITNNWAAGFAGDVKIFSSGGGGRYYSFQDFLMKFTSSLTIQCGGYARLQSNTGSNVTLAPGGTDRLSISDTAGGSLSNVTFTPQSFTAVTASTEIPGYLFNSYSRQWSTGAITTQREQYIKTVTYTAVGASVITNAYGLYIEAPTASTNITITNNWAAGFSGNVYVSGNVGIANTAPADYLCIGNNDGTTDKHIHLSYNNVIGASTGNGSLGAGGTNAFGFYMPSNSAGSSFLVNKFSSGTLNINAYRYDFTAQGNIATGAVTNFSFTANSNTNQTLSTEISGYLYNSYSRQWATGAITTQREQYVKTVTYTAVGASVITNAYGLYVEAPTASTNITITNNYAAGFLGNIIATGNTTFGTAGSSNVNNFNVGTGTTMLSIQAQVGSAARPAIYLNQTSPDTTNFALSGTSTTDTYLNGKSAARILANGAIILSVFPTSITYSPGAQSSGALIAHQFTNPTNTGLTASTNVPTFKVIGATQQWATGALTNQYFGYLSENTIAFVAASTVTNVYGLFIEPAKAGTNATITNNYALGLSGNLALTVAGNGIYIKEGGNATMGTAVLVAGSVVVNTTKVTANSRIILGYVTLGTVTVASTLEATTRVANTSFTINASVPTDTSTIFWLIVEPTP